MIGWCPRRGSPASVAGVDTGDTAPDFELTDQTGVPRRLSTVLADGPVVLFFYPIASSSGCTSEVCHFRDLGDQFAAAGAQPLGISPDDVATQKQFADAHTFDFPLLADPDGAVAAQYGVRRRGLLAKMAPVKRTTFVIGPDRTVLGVIASERKMLQHGDEALALLRTGS